MHNIFCLFSFLIHPTLLSPLCHGFILFTGNGWSASFLEEIGFKRSRGKKKKGGVEAAGKNQHIFIVSSWLSAKARPCLMAASMIGNRTCSPLRSCLCGRPPRIIITRHKSLGGHLVVMQLLSTDYKACVRLQKIQRWSWLSPFQFKPENDSSLNDKMILAFSGAGPQSTDK